MPRSALKVPVRWYVFLPVIMSLPNRVELGCDNFNVSNSDDLNPTQLSKTLVQIGWLAPLFWPGLARDKSAADKFSAGGM